VSGVDEDRTDLRILYIEPFEGGSHAQFTRTLTRIPARWERMTLPGRFWKWRMRGSAVWFALEEGPRLEQPFDLLWASAFLPLAELKGLVPSLARVPTVLHFHENQLAYPSRPGASEPERDRHFGFTQLVSGLAANRLVFNSEYNRRSFLTTGEAWLQQLPDRVPRAWIPRLKARSCVLPVWLDLPHPTRPLAPTGADRPWILWNHRWEHDKDPDTFVEAVIRLAAEGYPFQLVLVGGRARTWPAAFDRLRSTLPDRIERFGPVDGRTYVDLLQRCDVVVSTARQEFFGVSVIEATHLGAEPLVPDDLAYPEWCPDPYRYPRGSFEAALRRRLQAFAAGEALRRDRRHLTARFGAPLAAEYRRLIRDLTLRPEASCP
jgi:glycosyltransferase involved in cell wall biosynthesis